MQGAGLWWVVGVLLLLAGVAIYYYNRLVFNRARVAEAWSGIDVQLKRRASLIPALVECVRQYMSYEQGTLQGAWFRSVCARCSWPIRRSVNAHRWRLT